MENTHKDLIISVIVAYDKNRGISKNGKIPWKIDEDTHYFQDVTKSGYIIGKKNICIMGRKTWEELPSTGLPERIIIIISSKLNQSTFVNCNIYIAKNLNEAILKSKILCLGDFSSNRVFICGGAQLYNEAFRRDDINFYYITEIGGNYDCDNFINVPPGNSWQKDRTNMLVQDKITNNILDISFCEQSGYPFPFSIYHNPGEDKYLKLLGHIVHRGEIKQTRNSTVRSKFAKTLKFDLSKGFPLLTTKKMFFKGVVEELLFFLKGDTNAKHLDEKGVKIWNANTSRAFLDSVNLKHYEEGDMGPMYGFNLLHFGAVYEGINKSYEGLGYNQIEYCLNLLKNDPTSRRILMTTYNPSIANQGCLYPCHGIDIIFNVDVNKEDNYKLSCMMTQRSADLFLGVPFNIASYALLVHIFCEVINNDETYKGPTYSVGKLVMNFGDVHIYEEHINKAKRQLMRDPYNFPQLKINKKIMSVIDFSLENIELQNYNCHSIISAPMIA